MKWVLVAAAHWWTRGRCCSWWTQTGPEASGPLLASGEEEAGCTQWRVLDCKRSLPLLIQEGGVGRGEKSGVEVERKCISEKCA